MKEINKKTKNLQLAQLHHGDDGRKRAILTHSGRSRYKTGLVKADEPWDWEALQKLGDIDINQMYRDWDRRPPFDWDKAIHQNLKFNRG
jgi:hypothetical protein